MSLYSKNTLTLLCKNLAAVTLAQTLPEMLEIVDIQFETFFECIIMNLLGRIIVHSNFRVEKLFTTLHKNIHIQNSCSKLENKFACWETNCRAAVISALSGRFSQQSLSLLIITSKLQPSLMAVKKQIWHLRLLQVSSLLVTKHSWETKVEISKKLHWKKQVFATKTNLTELFWVICQNQPQKLKAKVTNQSPCQLTLIWVERN